jgi:ESS family glutamate:Na+ symporter
VPVTLRLNAVQVLALAGFGVFLGEWLKRRVRLLDRLSIPASVAGGLVYAVLVLALRGRVNFEMDMVLRDILMVGFFTAIGMGASWRVVRAGGAQVALFLAIATAGAVLQNLLGMALARVFGVSPLLGIISGSVALAGGPATSLAFGATFEKLGVGAAATVGLASATFGITAAGVLGGYIGARVIRRRKLEPAEPEAAVRKTEPLETGRLPQAVAVMAVAMGLGNALSGAIERAGVVLPSYIGAMIVAAAIRNLDDRFHLLNIAGGTVREAGNVSLYLFIVMALLNLRLWELAALAVPLMAMLIAQVALCWLMCELLAFWLMGRDYESAVMAAGFCGFMLGTTANSMGSMDELTREFGPAPRAFMVAPLVGAFLIDFTNALVITAMANWVR